MARIIDTDNYGGDYPNESFVLGVMPELAAQEIAALINKHNGEHSPRYYRVVPNDYVLDNKGPND